MKANQGKHRYDRSGRDLSLAPIYSMLMSRWCFKIYKWDEKVKTIIILNLNKKNLSSLCKTSIQIINPLSHNLKDLTSNTNLYRCTCSLPGSLSLGLTHLIQLPLLLISSLNTIVYKDDSSQAPRSGYKP